MTLKTYRNIKLAVVVVVAAITSQAVIFKSYLLPIATMVVAALLLWYARGRVQDIVADERDYALGGQSALLAIQIYAWIAASAMFVLYALRDYNPAFEPMGLVLSVSTCLLMLLYAFIFKYYSKISLSQKKTFYILLIVVVAIITTIVCLRVFSGEDEWICQNGTWQPHGHPSFSAPSVECKR